VKIVAIAGAFDPIRKGHLHLIKGAWMMGDYLKVILARDEQLIHKKGYAFMPYYERKEVLESIRWVSEVVENIDMDLSSCKSLAKYQPNIYARGGDKLPKEQWLEAETCKRFGIQMVDGVGGFDKESSSSELTGGKHGRECVYYIDVDNTLAFTKLNDYKNSQPNLEEIAKVNLRHEMGDKIIIWTSRGGTSGVNYRDLTAQQLHDWGVMYDELRMDKPSYDFLVCDKSRRTL
jgi:cytidyltransferase-like protein